MQQKLTLRLGGIMAAGIAVLIALQQSLNPLFSVWQAFFVSLLWALCRFIKFSNDEIALLNVVRTTTLVMF